MLAVRRYVDGSGGEERQLKLPAQAAKARRGGRTPRALLSELASLRLSFSSAAASRKRVLFEALAGTSLPYARDVRQLHELLLFARAYPDDESVLALVESVLACFESRPDLRRHRRKLTNSGIAGTQIRYEFYYPTAVALARRLPDRLHIDWKAWKRKKDLSAYLSLLVPPAETPALNESPMEPRAAIDFLRSGQESDAVFLALRFAAMQAGPFVREAIYDKLSPAMVLDAGPDSPSRTHAKAPLGPIVFQKAPLDVSFPDLARTTTSRRVRIREVDRREASLYGRMVTDAMVTRSRDLEAFSYASLEDVRLCQLDDGLCFVVLGQIPERRFLLECAYGALMMRNGIPIGYAQFLSLFGSAEILFNVFDTFRGAEAAHVFSGVLAVAHRLFGARTFSIDPFQLGHFGNHEGLKSGAWWFYHKLGFRPRDPDVLRLLASERRKIKDNPKHRSDLETLDKLSATPMFFSLGPEPGVPLGTLWGGHASEQVTRFLAARYGTAREEGIAASVREAAAICGVRSFAGWTADEKLAWERWCPLLLTVPGFAAWSATERRAAAGVARAKGGRRETDYLRKFNAHKKLSEAMLRLMTSD